MPYNTRVILAILILTQTFCLSASQNVAYSKTYAAEEHAAAWFLNNRQRFLKDSFVNKKSICNYTWLGRVFCDFVNVPLTDGPRLRFERISKNKSLLSDFSCERSSHEEIARYNQFRARILSSMRCLKVLCEERLTPEEVSLSYTVDGFTETLKNAAEKSTRSRKNRRRKQESSADAVAPEAKVMKHSENMESFEHAASQDGASNYMNFFQGEEEILKILHNMDTTEGITVTQGQSVNPHSTPRLMVFTTEEFTMYSPGYTGFSTLFRDVYTQILQELYLAQHK